MTDDDNAGMIIPFGKYKGSTVAELLERDRPYAEWVLAQGWVAQRFAELHAAIQANGAGSDETPEHNALQARFLDPGFRRQVLRLVYPDVVPHLKDVLERRMGADFEAWSENSGDIAKVETTIANWGAVPYGGYFSSLKEAERKLAKLKAESPHLEEKRVAARRRAEALPIRLLSRVSFEQAGVDVVIGWGYGAEKVESNGGNLYNARIELKPTMGDDYPKVMRQAQRLNCSVVVVESYNGVGVTRDQLVEMFKLNGVSMIFLKEIMTQNADPIVHFGSN